MDNQIRRLCRDIIAYQFHISEDDWWSIYERNLKKITKDLSAPEDIYLRILNGHKNPMDIRNTFIRFHVELSGEGYKVSSEKWKEVFKKSLYKMNKEMRLLTLSNGIKFNNNWDCLTTYLLYTPEAL